MKLHTWTVVRFPNGSWSYGGRMDEPEYAQCEKWAIEAVSGEAAVRKAQYKRRRDLARAELGLRDLSLRISCEELSFSDEDTCNMVQRHAATIFIQDERCRPVKIGELTFDVVDINAIRSDGESPLDVLDRTDADGYAAGEALFEPCSYGLREEVLEHVEPTYDRYLHLRELFIEPLWRGRKFGVAALHILLKRYSRGCDFAVLCASPIRVEVASEADRKVQQAALRNLYAKVGFKRLGRSLHMVQDLFEYADLNVFPFEKGSAQPGEQLFGSANL